MTDVVSDMLNETSKKRDKIKLIHIDDIRPNQLNRNFPMSDIEALALSLRVCGQIDPCIVMQDGDYYKLISGERRWRAAKLNVSQGFNQFEELMCIVRDYSEDELMLIAANGTRESIPISQKVEIVEKVLKHYELAKSRGEIPTGTKKREWISAVTGYSSRSVQQYLNILSQDVNDLVEKKKENIFLNDLQDRIMHKLDTKVKVTDKFIKVQYSDVNELNRMLEIMGLLEDE